MNCVLWSIGDASLHGMGHLLAVPVSVVQHVTHVPELICYLCGWTVPERTLPLPSNGRLPAGFARFQPNCDAVFVCHLAMQVPAPSHNTRCRKVVVNTSLNPSRHQLVKRRASMSFGFGTGGPALVHAQQIDVHWCSDQ